MMPSTVAINALTTNDAQHYHMHAEAVCEDKNVRFGGMAQKTAVQHASSSSTRTFSMLINKLKLFNI